MGVIGGVVKHGAVMAKARFGVGIYTVPEAARYTKVSSARIRRWMQGYSYPYKGETRESPPLWKHELPVLEEQLALSFRDLMELLFIDAFRRHGVSWKEIREAAEVAAEEWGTTHPFATLKFKTDRKKIIGEYAERSGKRRLLELVCGQYAMEPVLGPHLYEGVEFSGGEIGRWYPLEGSELVVLDPNIQFGKPVVLPSAVPTEVLASALRAEGSVSRVARWYHVSVEEVEAARDYEHMLAAKAA